MWVCRFATRCLWSTCLRSVYVYGSPLHTLARLHIIQHHSRAKYGETGTTGHFVFMNWHWNRFLLRLDNTRKCGCIGMENGNESVCVGELYVHIPIHSPCTNKHHPAYPSRLPLFWNLDGISSNCQTARRVIICCQCCQINTFYYIQQRSKFKLKEMLNNWIFCFIFVCT